MGTPAGDVSSHFGHTPFFVVAELGDGTLVKGEPGCGGHGSHGHACGHHQH